MWNIQTLEFAVKVASLKSKRNLDMVKGKNASLEYSATAWAWDLLSNYIHKNSHLDSATILEQFMEQMDNWQMQATHEDAKDACAIAHDYAECLYDTMFDSC